LATDPENEVEVREVIRNRPGDRFFLTVDDALVESEIYLSIKGILEQNGIGF